jgi:hypothetical protein
MAKLKLGLETRSKSYVFKIYNFNTRAVVGYIESFS